MHWLVLASTLLGLNIGHETFPSSMERTKFALMDGTRATLFPAVMREARTSVRARRPRPRQVHRGRPAIIPKGSSADRGLFHRPARAPMQLQSTEPQRLFPDDTSSPMNPAMGCIRSGFGCDD